MSPSVMHALSVGFTLLLLLVGYHVVQRLIDGLVQRLAAHQRDTARSRTLGSLLTSIVRWVLAFVVIVLILRELGVDVQAIVVSAGVLGVVLGLGAQALIRDLLTGIFLLFEGLVAVGDVIQVSGVTGTVESVGLRVTKLRLQDGAIRIVPNGALTEFTNFSVGWGRAIVEVGVPREVDVDRALAALREAGEAWARESGAALETPRVPGIMGFSGGDVLLRLTVRVAPERRASAEAELRRRIKAAFDREHWAPFGAAG